MRLLLLLALLLIGCSPTTDAPVVTIPSSLVVHWDTALGPGSFTVRVDDKIVLLNQFTQPDSPCIKWDRTGDSIYMSVTVYNFPTHNFAHRWPLDTTFANAVVLTAVWVPDSSAITVSYFVTDPCVDSTIKLP